MCAACAHPAPLYVRACGRCVHAQAKLEKVRVRAAAEAQLQALVAEDDDSLDPARITRLLEQKVGTDGRTVRDVAPAELVELAVRKRERRKETLKKTKKEERRLEELKREELKKEEEAQEGGALQVRGEAEAEAEEEAEEGEAEGGAAGRASRLLGRAKTRASDMWGGPVETATACRR